MKEHYSLEAEQSVLGSLMGEDSLTVSEQLELKHTDFFLSKHRYLFKAIESEMQKNDIAEPIGVTAWLTTAGVMHEFEAMEIVTMAFEAQPHNFKHHQNIVRNHSKYRTLERTLQKAQQKLLEIADADEVDALSHKIIDTLTAAETGPTNGWKTSTEWVTEQIEDIQIEKGAIQGVPTGFTEFDRMTSGLKEGELIIVGARPSMGKTAFALNLTTGTAKSGAIVAVYSLEMKTLALGRRVFSATSNINSHKLKQGGSAINPEDWAKLTMAAGELSTLDILINDSSGVSIHKIKQDLIKLRKQNPGRKIVCIIDYLQLVQGSEKYGGNRQQEISEISRILKTTALDHGIVMIALSQLSRGVEQRQDKRPMMSDLRESGAIEQDADIITFLYREEYYDKETESRGMVELIVAKNRDGEVGTVDLAFVKEYGKMINLERKFNS